MHAVMLNTVCIHVTGGVQIYLHYLPIRNGRETRKDLGLPGEVRWFTYWKGRSVAMADVTAM